MNIHITGLMYLMFVRTYFYLFFYWFFFHIPSFLLEKLLHNSLWLVITLLRFFSGCYLRFLIFVKIPLIQLTWSVSLSIMLQIKIIYWLVIFFSISYLSLLFFSFPPPLIYNFFVYPFLHQWFVVAPLLLDVVLLVLFL